MLQENLQRAFVAVGLALALPGGLHAMLPPAVGDPHDLTLRVWADETFYPPDAPIDVEHSICNETPHLIRFHVTHTLPPASPFEILDHTGAVVAYRIIGGSDAGGHTEEYEPGECSIFFSRWNQATGPFDSLRDASGPPVPLGSYRARVRVTFGGTTVILERLSAPFSIGAPAVPAPALSRQALLILIGSLALAAAGLLRR